MPTAFPGTSIVDDLPRFVLGVSDAEVDTIRSLYREWKDEQPRNILRATYFDGKMPIRNAGTTPEEAFARISAVTHDRPQRRLPISRAREVHRAQLRAPATLKRRSRGRLKFLRAT